MAVDSSVSESVSIWFRLLSCHAQMLAELRRQIESPKRSSRKRAPITLARFDLLANLHREDGPALSALSEALLVTAGNVTGLVTRAERDGLVVRRADEADRRVARVWLTRKGKKLIEELLPLHAEQVHGLLRDLRPAERRDVRRALGILRDRLAVPARSPATKRLRKRP